MKTPGDYALDHANGKPWADIIAEIREEAVADYRQVPYTPTEDDE